MVVPLAPSDVTGIITQDQLKCGGVIMTGLILCNRCRKKMDGAWNAGGRKCRKREFSILITSEGTA